MLVGLDNEGAVLAWNAGRSSNAQHVLDSIHAEVERFNVYLIAMHIPRALNVFSECLSYYSPDSGKVKSATQRPDSTSCRRARRRRQRHRLTKERKER